MRDPEGLVVCDHCGLCAPAAPIEELEEAGWGISPSPYEDPGPDLCPDHEQEFMARLWRVVFGEESP